MVTFSGCSAYCLDVILGYCFADFAGGVQDNGKRWMPL
jgi:hypothetical protein